jgi:hypothetical protein
MIAGYAWTAVLGLVLVGVVFLAARLFSAGSKHPDFRRRALLTWAAFALDVVLFSWLFRFPPISFIAAIGTAALAWPLARFQLLPSSPRGRVAFGMTGLLVAVTGCWGAANWYQLEYRMPPGDCSYLEGLRPNQAAKDAEQAVSRGDFHLLGVYGFTLEVPGIVERQTISTIRPIACTSDMLLSKRHMELVDAARVYADRYDRRVIALNKNRLR